MFTIKSKRFNFFTLTFFFITTLQAQNTFIKYNFTGKTYTLIDKAGNQIIPEDYTKIRFDHGLYIVKKNDKYGALYLDGSVKDSVIYDTYYFNNNYVCKAKDKYYHVYNLSTKGKVIDGRYKNVMFSKDHFTVQNFNGKKAVLDSLGKMIIPFEYDEFYFPHYDNDTDKPVKALICRQQRKVGVIDMHNNVLIPLENNTTIERIPKTQMSDIPFGDEVFLVYKTEGSDTKEGLFDGNGTPIFEMGEYNNIRISRTGEELIAVSKDGKAGYVNTKGKVKIPFEYEDAHTFKYGMASVKQNNSYGLINTKNKFVIAPTYSEKYGVGTPFSIINKNAITVYEKRNTVMLNGHFDMVYPQVTITPVPSSKVYAVRVRIDNSSKQGILDNDGNVLIDAMYRYIQPMPGITNKEGAQYFIFKTDKKYGVVDRNNRVVVKPIYTGIEYAYSNCFIIKQDDKYGVMDGNFKVIFEPQFVYIWKYQNANYLTVSDTSGKSYTIDSKWNKF